LILSAILNPDLGLKPPIIVSLSERVLFAILFVCHTIAISPQSSPRLLGKVVLSDRLSEDILDRFLTGQIAILRGIDTNHATLGGGTNYVHRQSPYIE